MAAGLMLLAGSLFAVAATPPPTSLPAAVHAGQWEEVRRQCAAQPGPLPPAVALVAARAERELGRPARAREILGSALRGGRELEAALRLELAETDLALGRDPWDALRPLLARRTPYPQRKAAEALLGQAWSELPPKLVTHYGRRHLSRSLRRRWRAVSALQRRSVSAALTVLKDTPTGPYALAVAPWLATQPHLAARDRLRVARALLTGGMWREADAILGGITSAEVSAHAYDLAYLRGRAAYRLGRMAEAAAHFEAALASAEADEERFDAAEQRARVAELAGAYVQARAYWEVARAADPTEPAAWEGVVRAEVVLGSSGDACASLSHAPSEARHVAGERLAALLLARGDGANAAGCLRFAAPRSPRAAFLAVAAAVARGDLEAARGQAEELLASPRAGAWRELVLDLPLPPVEAVPADETARDPAILAQLAVRSGVGEARAALRRALVQDPLWAEVVAGGEPAAPPLGPEVTALDSVGLEEEAARLYVATLPDATPAEAAWSAAHLARWGNGPAALATGETLWSLLGDVPAAILPTPLLKAILPPALVADADAAARTEGCQPALLAAVLRQESRFDRRVRSTAGAIGVAQLVPETARRLGCDPEDAWDEDLALPMAARELARLEARFGGRETIAAAAYNAGDHVVQSWLDALGDGVSGPLFAAAVPYSETSTYVLAVREGLSLARYLK